MAETSYPKSIQSGDQTQCIDGPERERACTGQTRQWYLCARNGFVASLDLIAALRATEDDIAQIAPTIVDMEAFADTTEAFVNADCAFHQALADATHNDLYGILLDPTAVLSLSFRMTVYKFDSEEAIQGGLAHHRRILEHVRARDADAARRAMQQAQALHHEKDTGSP